MNRFVERAFSLPRRDSSRRSRRRQEFPHECGNGSLKARSTCALALLIALPIFAQDPRQLIEESQRRARSNSLRYEGVLEVIGGGNRVSKKSWINQRFGSFGASK